MKNRYNMLDVLRGFTLINMVLYHACWDVKYIFGEKLTFMGAQTGYVWQQMICWAFILISGFCWSLGKKPLQRGLIVFGWGALFTLVTVLAMPENRVMFGVLTFLGSAMLLMIPFNKLFVKVPPVFGALVSVIFFVLTRNINSGYIGFESFNLFAVPNVFYQNDLTAFFGFPNFGFYSTDYFSLFPWFFLFCVGYFFYKFAEKQKNRLSKFWEFLKVDFAPLSFLGRNCLTIYVLHQPLVLAVLFIWFWIF